MQHLWIQTTTQTQQKRKKMGKVCMCTWRKTSIMIFRNLAGEVLYLSCAHVICSSLQDRLCFSWSTWTRNSLKIDSLKGALKERQVLNWTHIEDSGFKCIISGVLRLVHSSTWKHLLWDWHKPLHACLCNVTVFIHNTVLPTFSMKCYWVLRWETGNRTPWISIIAPVHTWTHPPTGIDCKCERGYPLCWIRRSL